MKTAHAVVLMASLLAFQSESFGGEEKFCASLANCSRGSIIQVTGFEAQKYCDFTQSIVPVMRFFLSQDDLTQGAAYNVQCVYRGSERTVEGDPKRTAAD